MTTVERLVDHLRREHEESRIIVLASLRRLSDSIDQAIRAVEEGSSVSPLKLSSVYAYTESIPRWNHAVRLLPIYSATREDKT